MDRRSAMEGIDGGVHEESGEDDVFVGGGVLKSPWENYESSDVPDLYLAAVDCFQGPICGIEAEDFVKLRTELFEFLRVQRGPHRTSVDDREDSDHRDGDVYPNSDSRTTDKGMEYDSRRDGDGTNHMAMEASISDSVQTAPTQSLPKPPSQLEPHLPMQTDPTPSLPTPPATTQTATAAAAQLQPHPPMQTALIPSLPTPSSTTQTATTEAAQLQPFLTSWNAAGSGNCGIIDVLEANFVKPAALDDANQDEVSHDQVSFEYNEPQQDLLPHGRIPKRIRTSLSMIQEQAALIDILVEERKRRDEVEAGLRETRREAYNTISELVKKVKELVEKVKQLEGRGSASLNHGRTKYCLKRDKNVVFMSVDDSPIKEIYVDEFKRVDGSGDEQLHQPPRWMHTLLHNTYCPPVGTNCTSTIGSNQISVFVPVKSTVYSGINEEGISPSFFNEDHLGLPPSFRIILHGKEVEHHNIVNDLMLTKELTYKPQYLSNGEMVTTMTIGFVKDARHHIDIQGFNIYHKNRLIQPFWRLWNPAGSDGRGIRGVLEANFVKPAHDKQRFESSAALDRLKNRLIKIQKEYWANNCQEIGYAPRASQHSKKTSSSKRKSGSPSAAADDADQDEISHDQESFEYDEAQQNLLPHGRISKSIRTSLSMKKGSSEMRQRQD
ncbi:hypothetical protein EZV62_019365 [Acer yangbiense]|uniref:Morc S5 domain-containing protein n=1 Tax=Acer yangbiense TaxID=1000413 RepID=A0A5C7HBA1_9ROSI|nr:hypothetical protein EZV62_019365 [Acer yangbiense]